MGEVVCVLGKTVSVMVCRSHANPLLRVWAGLRSVAIAGKRAISSAVVSQIPRLFL